MPVYHLPAKPEVAEAIAAGHDVVGRLIEVAEGAGYVIGEGGIQGYPDGSVTIDADRDPTADWLAWDPAVPSQQEQEDAAVRAAIRAARDDLALIVERSQQGANLSQAEIKAGFRLLATTLDDLVAWLDRIGGLRNGAD